MSENKTLSIRVTCLIDCSVKRSRISNFLCSNYLEVPYVEVSDYQYELVIIERLDQVHEIEKEDKIILLLVEGCTLDEEIKAISFGVDEIADINKVNIEAVRRIVIRSISRKNITKKNEDLKEALLRSAKLSSIGLMASGIVHELNNPLTALKGFCHVLNKKKNDEEKVKEIAQKIDRVIDRMTRVVNGIRIYSKDRGFDSSDFFQPITAINDVVGFMEMTLSSKGVSLKLESEIDDELKIWGNRSKFESIFQNLIANSGDAVSSFRIAGGEIVVRVKKHEDEMLLFEIEDNGPGMSSELVEKIFDPFVTTKKLGEGTGLGMGIVKDAIEVHKGEIDIISAEGDGTTIKLLMPIDRRANRKKSEHDRVHSSKMGKILIVDDDIDITEAFRNALEDHYEVIISNSSVGVPTIPEGVSLVITDLVMPKIDGFELAKMYKQQNPNIPIWLVSTNHKLNDMKNEVFVPFDRVFLKPITNFQEVIDALEELFEESSEKKISNE